MDRQRSGQSSDSESRSLRTAGLWQPATGNLGNDIDLNLSLTRLGNIFPPPLQAALVASFSHAPQPQRRNEPKTRPFDLGIDKSHRGKRKKVDRETDAGGLSTLDRILRSLNDVKSVVGGFRKLLLDHGFTQEDPTPSTKQRQYAAAGKDNGQEPKPRFHRQEKCAAAATKAKTKDKTSSQAQPFVPVRQEPSSDCGSEDDECANMASVKKAPLPRIDFRAMKLNERTILRRHAAAGTSPSQLMKMRCYSPPSPPCASWMTTLWEASSALACLQAFPVIRW
jgi:hypothetical protein